MTVALLVRRFLADHARNPVNVLVLALVPVVFVMLAAEQLSRVGDVLGGDSGRVPVEAITAGWAAGFVGAIGMYFQVSTARQSDRRLVIAGLRRRTLTGARMLTGAALGTLAAATAVAALATRGAIDDPARVVAGTALFTVIYLSLGALAGAFIRNPVNATMVLLFVWIVDVFFGPAMNGTDHPALRALPTHFVTLWTAGLEPGHAGPGPLLGALAWAGAAFVLAYLAVLQTTSLAREPRAARAGPRSQVIAGIRMAWRSWRRTPVLWVLLVAVPTVFIWLADVLTPHGSIPVRLREEARDVVILFDPAHIHAGTMAPIAIGSLAALAGVFIALDAQSADQRLVIAGVRPRVVLAVRLSTVAAACALATAASLGLTAVLFGAHQWPVYALGNGLIAVTYGLVGMIVGPAVGRVSGSLIAFLVPFLDLAIGQSPMLREGPSGWAQYLPGYGATRVLLDGALTETFDEGLSLLIAAAWVLALVAAASVQIRYERASGMLPVR